VSVPTPDPGTIVVYTDVACGWSTVAIHRLLAARHRLGLDDDVHLDHRLFFLEDVNRAPVSLRLVDAEIPVLAALEPDLGLRPFPGDPSTWPVSSLLANEAVHAAKAQGPAAAEQLDLALRLALFRDGRCISLLHEVLDVAGTCAAVDAGALGDALADGRARGAMLRDYGARVDDIQGSPHLFLPDGHDVHNPGVELHWEGPEGAKVPVVDADDPGIYDELVRRAPSSVARASRVRAPSSGVGAVTAMRRSVAPADS
jgi:predicted DsbA family dithiol-disulfide isomerase